MKKIFFLLTFTTLSLGSTYWEAIAINRRTGDTGYSYDFSTESQATKAALSECEGDCEIGVSFYNSCGAIAHSSKTRRYGNGWDDEYSSRAEREALKNCGQKDCEIVQSVCTSWDIIIY